MANSTANILFIGGSGMLLNLVKIKLEDGCKVALLCRNPPALKGDYHPIACNYNTPEDFPRLIEEYMAQNGTIDHIVCWMRTGSVYPFLALCELLAKKYDAMKLWHLRGSSWYDDPEKLPFEIPDDVLKKLNFYKIYLGSVEEESSKRWLKDDEICSGVERAMSLEKELYCIGNFPPFDSLS